jgi:predicted MFS family arabinose efflux permease
VRETPRLVAVLYVTVVFNLACWPLVSMVPVIAQEQLQLGTRATGLLASMEGVGALLASLLLMSLARRLAYGHVYVGGTLLFMLATPVFALATHPLLAAAALMLVGAGQAGFAVMQSTLVFVTATQARRLEAMGLLTMCIGVAPIGFFVTGWLAERWGAPTAAVINATVGLATMALTWRVWRPIVAGPAR